MSCNSDFQQLLIKRSREILKRYRGKHDATILINCMLGLLVVPNQACFDEIPETNKANWQAEWGISPRYIIKEGKHKKNSGEYNLKWFVKDLRDSICHFHLKPIPEYGEVEKFRFWTDAEYSGFEAEVPLSELRPFVTKLADFLVLK